MAGKRNNRKITSNFLDIVWCQVKFRYYLKFRRARTEFCRVIKGKVTSAGHCTVFPNMGQAPEILFK